MKIMTAEDYTQLVEEMAPLYLAEEWDHCGLQLGDLSSLVERVMISLDVSPEVIKEVVKKRVQLLISHHPLFFQPLKGIDLQTKTGQLIKEALVEGLIIYSAHTNLDNCSGGINDYLASLLHLEDTRPLKATCHQRFFKLVVFVPPDHLEGVQEALSSAGAGWIGNYSHCTFQLLGEGTFKPLEGSHPFIGNKGRLEQVQEVRLETIIPREKETPIIAALMAAHPYEEVAFDVYPLENIGRSFGPGRLGYLPEGLPLQSLVEKVKDIFNLTSIQLIGANDNLQRTIERVALCSGSGGHLMDEAIDGGAQIYLTGDLKYHQLRQALDYGLLVLSVPHHVTEKVGLMSLRDHLLKEGREKGYSFELLMAQETFPGERL